MSHLSTQLEGLTAEQVEDFFAGADPELIVGLIDETSDAELRSLIDVEHIRESAVRNVLGRLTEFALTERLGAVQGIVEFELVERRGSETHALRFDGRSVQLVEPGQYPADVTISTGILDFVRLVSGGVNAALLLLTGRLSVRGDEQLALAVGGVFQVPGQPGVAVDPAAVDPDAVAAALDGVKDAHLDDVMSSGFRDVVLEQIFSRFPEFLDQAKAAPRTFAVAFKVTGRPDGGADRYLVRIDRGTCTVEEGADGDRDATLTLSGTNFLKLVTGHLNPVTGVMRGALKVKGDLGTALTMYRIMHIPGRDAAAGGR
jgi:putative sterol carrier protein